MAKLEGHLQIDIVGNGPRVLFTPNVGEGKTTRPYLAKSTEELRNDLVNVWQFTPEKADAAIARLEAERHVDLTISVDEPYIRHLFPTG